MNISGRLMRRLNRLLNQGLDRLETAVFHPEGQLPYRPLFIIGPPRSGSTLLYQAMVNYYQVGYLSNLHCLFYGAPSLVAHLAKHNRGQPVSGYQSQHGHTDGWAAPSECGQFWYRFFRRKPQYVPPGEADSKKMRQLRAVMHTLAREIDQPVLFKNLVCSMRLQPLAEALPEALFIVIKRDLTANAHSLLKARWNTNGEYTTWFSVEPPGLDALRSRPPYAQVVEQIRQIEARIAADRAIIGPDRFVNIDYEAFCDDPYRVLAHLDRFFAQHNLQLAKRAQIPAQFARNTTIDIQPELYHRLMEYIAETEPNTLES